MMLKDAKYFDSADFYAVSKSMLCNEIELLEKEFALYIGTRFAVATSFGRTALYLGLRSIGVVSMEVIIPAFICTVVRHAVTMAGGIPTFVDVDPIDFTYNVSELKRITSDRTKAIILTHYFGNVAGNIDEIIEFARQNNLILIEDCAHSLGAEWKGQKIGVYGDFSIFSLTKGMVNFGGGMLLTNNKEIFDSAKYIMDSEKNNLIKRIGNLSLVIPYGLGQFLNKVILNRVKPTPFKWWLVKIPVILLIIREFILRFIGFLKHPFARKKAVSRLDDSSAKKHGEDVVKSYDYGIKMEPLIASLARSQLKKNDRLIEKRMQTYRQLSGIRQLQHIACDKSQFKNVYTNLIFRFNHDDIIKLIQKGKKQGLMLRATWPTHQKLWKNQDTENVNIIKESILTWEMNPMLGGDEVLRFKKILNEF